MKALPACGSARLILQEMADDGLEHYDLLSTRSPSATNPEFASECLDERMTHSPNQ
jgi:hypothetical protein